MFNRIINKLCNNLMTMSYVLSNTNDSDDVALFVASSCGVEQNFNASTVLGDQWEFEVLCFCPAKGSIKDCLDGSLEIFCDKLLNQGMTLRKRSAMYHFRCM